MLLTSGSHDGERDSYEKALASKRAATRSFGLTQMSYTLGGVSRGSWWRNALMLHRRRRGSDRRCLVKRPSNILFDTLSCRHGHYYHSSKNTRAGRFGGHPPEGI